MSQAKPAPKKSLGQHWLRDAASLQAMIRAAQIRSTDTVLEIGPGLGTLTELLVQQARQVYAVEFDRDLAFYLHNNLRANNLTVVQEDILRFDLTRIPPGYKVAANVPYYITGKILQMLMESKNPPIVAALLVQKEVAERIAARPGQMTTLSVAVQFYAQPMLGPVIPAHLFDPAPKVDSQIITLIHRGRPRFHDVSAKEYFHLVKAGFAERRKKLRSSLTGSLQLTKEEADRLLESAHIPLEARAQELSLDNWHVVVKAYRKLMNFR